VREPVRWRDDESAPSNVRALLGSAERSRRLPAGVRARSAARLDRLVVLPAASGLLLWLKGLAIAAGVGAVGAVTVTQALAVMRRAPPSEVAATTSRLPPPPRQEPSRPPHGKPALPALEAAPAAPVVPFGPTAPSAARDRVAVSPRPLLEKAPSPPAASVDVDALSEEAAMLERARASLDRDPGAALAQLDAHAIAFPGGMLRTERELLAVDALGRLGHPAEARARGEALLREGHGSLYEERVRAMLKRLPPP
jgi:hypothetical protein